MAVRKSKHPSLGSQVTTFAVQPLGWRHFFLLFIPLCLVALSLVGVGYWRAIYGYTNFGPATALFWGQPWFLSAAFLTIAILLYALWRIHHAHTWVKVYVRGIIVHRPPSRKRTLRWEEIAGLSTSTTKRSFLGWKSGLRHTLTLHPTQGPSIQLNHRIKHLEDLIIILKKQVYPRLIKQLKEAFQANKDLHFGALSISKTYLSYQEKDIPWTYIQGITAANGYLIIRLSPQKHFEIPSEKIQNMELLVKLIKEEVQS
ncbi:MAG: DUF6585 family protein [Anaerolineales bacterium]